VRGNPEGVYPARAVRTARIPDRSGDCSLIAKNSPTPTRMSTPTEPNAPHKMMPFVPVDGRLLDRGGRRITSQKEEGRATAGRASLRPGLVLCLRGVPIRGSVRLSCSEAQGAPGGHPPEAGACGVGFPPEEEMPIARRGFRPHKNPVKKNRTLPQVRINRTCAAGTCPRGFVLTIVNPDPSPTQ
jgi:hypothetical protein